MREELQNYSSELRMHIIDMLTEAGSGHPGGSLSAADILTYLYFQEMNVDPTKKDDPDRDRFVLSKGHAAPVLYGALAMKGFIDLEELKNLRKLGSMLQGHPDMKRIPGVDMSTGSLGQGFSASVGMAIGNKLDNKESRVYVLLGDGEIQEGIVWEAAMAASHYKLDNLVAIVDHNGLQIDGPNDEVMTVSPLKEKWESFGWNVIEINGHSFEDIENGFSQARTVKGKPSVLIADTVKGKGVSFMENQIGWHGVAPSEQDRINAFEELQGLTIKEGR
ncbi:transketolase [Anaerobacillus alkalilacustris]|uniref:Transketolase n=1 Tax=Anaerobacillus alkalilacustris TaxID=393763 RepID=A0A1S2LJ85_9BACI|nr:transketolase [Anaerobacillus alkalilacustris]OIJ12572.1 transketolase [Anaerobacillus alkalilacustris]